MPACSRFLKIRKDGAGEVWVYGGKKDPAAAALIYRNGCLFPVFNARADIPLPPFLDSLSPGAGLHAIQGLREEAALIEAAFERRGIRPSYAVDYELMTLEEAPEEGPVREGSPKLIVKEARAGDIEALTELHAAYEREEVLPPGAAFDPARSRRVMERLLAEETVFAAFLNGRAVGKINTNARSFTIRQIGGVYVTPAWRGRGIGERMSAAFLRRLLRGCPRVTLYVKKRNLPALSMYRSLGFTAIGDYRIAYY